MRNIEYQTSQRIEVATLPTVADLQSRRLELARATLRESIIEGELDRFRVIVESLAEEFDVMDIAAAAVKLLETRSDGGDEPEIPSVMPRERDVRSERSGGKSRGERSSATRAAASERSSRRREAGEPTIRLWVGAGRKAKMRPGDLVGAIANEAGVDASVIGAIQIADGFSTVDVPASMANDIVEAIRGTTIKGRKVSIRRDRAPRSR